MQSEYKIGNEKVTTLLESRPDGVRTVTVGDHRWTVDFASGSLICEGSDGLRRSWDYACWQSAPGSASILCGGHTFEVTTPKRGASASSGTASGTVSAPMNGQVVKILKEPGVLVEEGEVVLTLEAMKMENEVSSPIRGRLVEVGVSVGQSVEPGKLLFRVEVEQDGDNQVGSEEV